MSRNTDIIRYRFRGSQAPPAVANRMGDFCSLLVGAGGPTVLAVSGGPMQLLLDNDNQVQSACLYQGNILPFDINDLIRVEFMVRQSVALTADDQFVIGLGGAQNADPTLVTQAAMFRMTANANVLIDTRDGTNTVAGAATGQTLAAVYRRLVIDFASGNLTQSPPGGSVGGLGDVRFYMSNLNGSLRRVAQGQRFRMDAFGGNLQIIAQLQKTQGVSVAAAQILGIDVEYKLPR